MIKKDRWRFKSCVWLALPGLSIYLYHCVFSLALLQCFYTWLLNIDPEQVIQDMVYFYFGAIFLKSALPSARIDQIFSSSFEFPSALLKHFCNDLTLHTHRWLAVSYEEVTLLSSLVEYTLSLVSGDVAIVPIPPSELPWARRCHKAVLRGARRRQVGPFVQHHHIVFRYQAHHATWVLTPPPFWVVLGLLNHLHDLSLLKVQLLFGHRAERVECLDQMEHFDSAACTPVGQQSPLRASVVDPRGISLPSVIGPSELLLDVIGGKPAHTTCLTAPPPSVTTLLHHDDPGALDQTQLVFSLCCVRKLDHSGDVEVIDSFSCSSSTPSAPAAIGRVLCVWARRWGSITGACLPLSFSQTCTINRKQEKIFKQKTRTKLFFLLFALKWL